MNSNAAIQLRKHHIVGMNMENETENKTPNLEKWLKIAKLDEMFHYSKIENQRLGAIRAFDRALKGTLLLK